MHSDMCFELYNLQNILFMNNTMLNLEYIKFCYIYILYLAYVELVYFNLDKYG